MATFYGNERTMSGTKHQKLYYVNDFKKDIKKGYYRHTSLYEYIGYDGLDKSVHPYFDIDVHRDDEGKPDDWETIFDHATQFITEQFQCQKTDLVYAFGHRPNKWSCHMTIPSLKTPISNLIAWKDLQLETLKKLYIDDQVYRGGEGGSMRMVGTENPKKPGSFLIRQNGDIEDHLITVLSGKEKEYLLPVPQKEQQRIEQKATKKIKIRVKTPTYDVELAQQLCTCLINNDLSWGEWNNVGLCLHNISEDLLPQWIAFSQMSPKNNEEQTQKQWQSYQTDDDGLKLPTLKMWAKRDNPQLYQQIIRKYDIFHLILHSLTGTPYDIALVVYQMFKDEFAFVGKKGWYHFLNHHWETSYNGTALSLKLSTDVFAEYQRVITYYQKKLQDLDEDKKEEREKIKETIKELEDITHLLKTTVSKSHIMKELSELFLDARFESKLDQNPTLLGFNNGVYDLTAMTFRDGCPQDYLSKSTGYDFTSIPKDDPIAEEILSFLHLTFPQEKVEGEEYDQMDASMIIYSSMLEGYNKEQHFYIQSNKGSNGKTQIVNLLSRTLGQYACSVRPVFFTQDVKVSAGAASPELSSLVGIRLIYAEEPNEGDKFNIGKIKEVTGTSNIKCRPLYGDEFEYLPQFKCLFSCNKLPTFANVKPDDISAWRRIRNIPFVSTFVDPEVEENEEAHIYHKNAQLTPQKMDEWRNGFMNLLLDAYRTYHQKGIISLQAMKLADEAYKTQVDPLNEYFTDHIEVSEIAYPTNVGLALREIWNAYKSDKAYYRKDIKMKDITEYCQQHKYHMEEQDRLGGSHRRTIFTTLKWIEDEPEENVKSSGPSYALGKD